MKKFLAFVCLCFVCCSNSVKPTEDSNVSIKVGNYMVVMVYFNQSEYDCTKDTLFKIKKGTSVLVDWCTDWDQDTATTPWTRFIVSDDTTLFAPK
jgi:hypothetical protein